IDQSQKMSIKKGEANVSEDDDKAMAVLMALIWMESSSIGATIARLNNGTFLSLTQSALIEFGYKGNAADAAEKLAESWKANYAGRIGEMLNANSKEMVKKVLADAIENNKGGNLPALLVAIKVGLESISERIDYRSQQIAQNEVLSTGNEGRYMAALIAGKRTKVWKTVGDSKVRDWHKAANGQTVAIGDYFIVNGERMLYPKDPNGSAANVVNCRCWAEYK
ncbi:MAG: phage minor head protein, partial [Eubacterium sp.]